MPPTKKGRKRKVSLVEIESDQYEYEKQEIILCYHGPQLYKAKVLRRTVNNSVEGDQVMYFVHYHGWNQQWDEWVTSDRCLKETEENLELMKTKSEEGAQMKQKRSSISKANKRKRQIEDSDESDSDTATKSTRSRPESKQPDELHFESMLKQQQTLKMQDLDDLELNAKINAHREKKRSLPPFPSMPSSPDSKRKKTTSSTSFRDKLKTIIIPTALKDALVEQYNVIHYDEKIIKLPKAKGLTINDILRNCLEEQQHKLKLKRDKNGVDPDDLKAAEFVTETLPFINNGLKGFFKNTLKLNLLYNFEKPQLEKLLMEQGEDCDLCEIYGAEHLIRLFYILPNILIHTQGVHESNFSPIKQCVSILIHYLSKNKQRYLGSPDVEAVPEKYVAAAKRIARKYNNKLQTK